MPPRKRFAAYQILEESSHAKHWKSRRKNEWIKFCRNNWKERPTPWGEQPPEWLIPRVHPGDYMYNDNTVEGFVMSRQGDVWRTPLECRMEGPIRVPQIGVSHWRALLHAESLVEGPDCGAQPGELEGCKFKRKAKTSRRKNPSLPKCHQEQNHPDFCWCYFQQCARLNMCFR